MTSQANKAQPSSREGKNIKEGQDRNFICLTKSLGPTGPPFTLSASQHSITSGQWKLIFFQLQLLRATSLSLSLSFLGYFPELLKTLQSLFFWGKFKILLTKKNNPSKSWQLLCWALVNSLSLFGWSYAGNILSLILYYLRLNRIFFPDAALVDHSCSTLMLLILDLLVY